MCSGTTSAASPIPTTIRGADWGCSGTRSILTLTSYANRTSPVLRGKYVLGESARRAAAAATAEHSRAGHRKQGLRQGPPDAGGDGPAPRESRMRELPRADGPDWLCAWIISTRSDRWRTVDASGATIDPSGVLPDGTRFEGMAGLRQVLLSHPERFVSTLTENLLAYALGRSLEYYDQPVVRAIVRDAAPQRLSLLGVGVSASSTARPFQTRKAEACSRRAPRRQRIEETTIMIITKRALPRRTFLRGMGATVALPFLDAMVPALALARRRQADPSDLDLSISRTARFSRCGCRPRRARTSSCRRS